MNHVLRFLQPDSRFGQWLRRILDLFCLSILWAGLCLTVIGIGPATTALCYTVRHSVRLEEQPLLRTFLGAMADGWRQSIPAGLVMALFTAALWFTDGPGLFLACTDPQAHLRLLTLFSLGKLLLLVWVWLYLFPILAAYRVRLAGAFFQALALAFSHIGTTVAMTCLLAGVLFALARYPLLIVIAPGLCAYGFSFLTQGPLASLAPPAQDEQAS